MILITLIKKEIMHFFRNKSNVATMFIFPIVLIIVMGFSLNGLMNVDKNIFENEKVFYEINNLRDENKYLKAFESFKENCEKNMNIRFEEVSSGRNGKSKAKNMVDTSKGLAFISVYEDKYDYYRSENKESKSQKIFRFVFEEYLEKFAVVDMVASKNSYILKNIENEEGFINIKEEGINSKGINSFTYYTFAELVLIILYISQITSVSIYNERFQGTLYRLKISKANNCSIIFSKVILGTIVGILQIIIVYFVSTIFLHISWGENIIKIIMVLISLIIFSSVFGITMSLIFVDSKASLSVINVILIILGFLGGAYVPISLIKAIRITNILCQMTPTYWANVSLLSLSTGINTNYSNISIGISLGLSIILFIIGIVVSSFRVGDNNG